MSRQMSSAMMSAPSAASRTACARPWPRAAPVMKATLPSRSPTRASPCLVGQTSGVNAGQPQAFLRIVDFDVPVVAGTRAAVVPVLGQDRLSVARAAGVGDAGEELQRLLVQSTVVRHAVTP